MNHWKQAWNDHAQGDYSPITKQDRREENSFSFIDQVVDELSDEIIEGAIVLGLAYMATSHYGKLRIVGSVGLRLVPVVGVALVAYGIYKFLD